MLYYQFVFFLQAVAQPQLPQLRRSANTSASAIYSENTLLQTICTTTQITMSPTIPPIAIINDCIILQFFFKTQNPKPKTQNPPPHSLIPSLPSTPQSRKPHKRQ